MLLIITNSRWNLHCVQEKTHPCLKTISLVSLIGFWWSLSLNGGSWGQEIDWWWSNMCQICVITDHWHGGKILPHCISITTLYHTVMPHATLHYHTLSHCLATLSCHTVMPLFHTTCHTAFPHFTTLPCQVKKWKNNMCLTHVGHA